MFVGFFFFLPIRTSTARCFTLQKVLASTLREELEATTREEMGFT